MTSLQRPVIVTITQHLPLVEKVLLTALAIGAILTLTNIDSTVTKAALVGLAITFFLMAYRPIDSPQNNEPFGFKELLIYTIVPKILWVSCAVSALGIAFYLFQFGNNGYKNMLLVGGQSIALCVLLFIGFTLGGVRPIRPVTLILLRAVPLCAVDFYLFFRFTEF